VQKIRQILTLLFLAATVFYTQAALAEVKIAVVDRQTAILQSEEAKKLLRQIEEEFKDKQQKVRDMEAERTALLERAQKDGEVMSPSEQGKLQSDIESLSSDLSYWSQKYQKEIVDRQRELLAGFNKKLQTAIEELVLSEDYDMVINREAAFYVGELYDITRKTTEKLNAMDKSQ